MESKDTKLYDAFGELLYVLVCADGEIQQEELDTLQDILHKHPWSKEIMWSFDYEISKENDIDDLYQKVLYACYDIGPHPQYTYMLEVLEAVAESSLGMVEEERRIIKNFKTDLIEEFRKRS